MNTVHTIWHAHLLSIRNAGRHDTRLRIAFIAVSLFDIAVGLWSGSQLIARITAWQTLGPVAVQAGLWSLCVLTWSGMGLITIVESLLQGIGNDQTLLLFTLPIRPSDRFHALYGTFFIGRLWNWLLLEMGITGVALAVTLGWKALIWLALLQLGVACAVMCALLATLLVVGCVLTGGRLSYPFYSVRWERPLKRAATRAPTPLNSSPAPTRPTHLLKLQLGIWIVVALFVVALFIYAILTTWLSPELACLLLFALFLLVTLGPLAEAAGRLYGAAFVTIQSWDRSRKARVIPGIGLLTRLLARQRNLAGALLVKGVLSQSRNVLFWARVIFIIVALAFFPLVRSLLAHYRISDTLFVVGYTSGLAMLSILEQAPNAFSSEGNRLTLYLVAPFSLAEILRAKLMVFLLPVLLEGLTIGLFLSWRLGLTLSSMSFATMAIILVILGCTALPVWGSVWDEDLNLMVEGAMQTLMQEEAAITRKRLALLNLSMVLLAASFLLIWKLPALFALLTLILLDGVVLMTMWYFGRTQLRRLRGSA